MSWTENNLIASNTVDFQIFMVEGMLHTGVVLGGITCV